MEIEQILKLNPIAELIASWRVQGELKPEDTDIVVFGVKAGLRTCADELETAFLTICDQR